MVSESSLSLGISRTTSSNSSFPSSLNPNPAKTSFAATNCFVQILLQVHVSRMRRAWLMAKMMEAEIRPYKERKLRRRISWLVVGDSRGMGEGGRLGMGKEAGRSLRGLRMLPFSCLMQVVLFPDPVGERR